MMNSTRRQFLKRTGLTTLVLVSGGLVWRAVDNGVFNIGEGPAYEPWRNWQSDADKGPLTLVRAGILAANAHNTQPWLFRIAEGQIKLYADTSRNLGSFDPYLREMHISLGCALTNMEIAASASGYGASIDIVPGKLHLSEDTPADPLIATITLTPATIAPSALYGAIPHRHTNRGAYDLGHSVPASAKDAFRDPQQPGIEVYLADNAEALTELGTLIVSSTEQIIKDHEMSGDSSKWFRMSRDDVDQYRDGVTIDAFGLPPMMNVGAKIIPAPSAGLSDSQWLSGTRDTHVGTAPLLGAICVADLYDKATAIKAGMQWQRMHLWATDQGMAMHPLNQPAELVDRDQQLGRPSAMADQLANLMAPTKGKPTFFFRAGYAERPARLSPRRPLKSVIL
ncbi:MAG: twin-arginine translocation signal domain-containing protein [Alphaproteobacteria bacterium]|nr:MAG: twin-arginine translocation signal domain-containing protein [Alphaproteobacteria bacterium]